MPRQRRRHGHRPDGFHYTVLCHQFPGRDRQETLDEIYLDNLLTCQVNGSRGVHIPQGDRMAARKLAEGGLPIGYAADLTDYSQRKDGMRYEVYLMITTRDGMRYVTPDNPIASFSSYEGGREIREPCGRFSVDTPWHPYSGPQTHPGKGKSM